MLLCGWLSPSAASLLSAVNGLLLLGLCDEASARNRGH